MNNETVCIFGEVLFDHFPDGNKVLGGAPFNVAWHLHGFGQAPFFISRVGYDPEGIAIRKAMLDWGMNTLGLETDRQFDTGRVSIEIINGEPEYDIVHPSAYDTINGPEIGQCHCRLLYHGSLALRNATSRNTLQKLVENDADAVFIDVNLRNPWWDMESVLEQIRQANWVKLNEHELQILYSQTGSLNQTLGNFLTDFDLQGVILTLGSKGAVLMMRDGQYLQISPSKIKKIVDTVGAGDAFASIIILGLVHDWSMELTLARAQRFASEIVGHQGATINDRHIYQSFYDEWFPRN